MTRARAGRGARGAGVGCERRAGVRRRVCGVRAEHRFEGRSTVRDSQEQGCAKHGRRSGVEKH